MKNGFLAIALAVFALPCLASSNHAVVLDTDGKTIAVIDAAKGTVVMKAPLADVPRKMILSPDGRRIAVLSRGEGTESFWTGRFTPKTKSSITLVDVATLKTIARSELGWDVGRAAFSRDGTTITVLTPGVSSNKPAEARPAELIRVKAATGEVVKRMTLPRAAESFELSSNGATGAIFFPTSGPKIAEVQLVDMAELTAVTTIPLAKETAAAVALIHDRLYFGDTNLKAPKVMHDVSLTDRKLEATLDTGGPAMVAAVDPDRGEIYLLTASDELRIVRGTTLSPGVKVGRGPTVLRFSDDRKTAYVLGVNNMTVVDLTKMSAGTPIKIRSAASDFITSNDGRRGFVMHRNAQSCCYATVVDLTSQTEMKSFITGSKAARIGQALAAAAATYGSYQSGRSSAAAHGGGTFYYTVYTPRVAAAARGPLAVRRDGKFAYALDVQTNDLTVIDGESGERLQNIRVGSGGQELVPLGSGRHLAVVADSTITVIDTESNTVKSEIKLAGEVRDFVLSPRGDYAVALGKGKIVTLDTRTAAEVGTIEELKRPAQLVFFAE